MCGSDGSDGGEKCSGAGNAAYDAGVTGLALLAFLGAGYTQAEGSYQETVGSGLAWLRSIQTEEGLIGTRDSPRFQYNHACAALALIEAYGMTQAEPLHASAQKALEWILHSKNEKLGWRYGVADGDNDSSVTSWMGGVLKSAAMSGLEVDPQALRDAVAFADEMTDPITGRTGYQTRGGRSSRAGEKEAHQFPPQNSEALTAMGVFTRILARSGREDPMVLKGVDLLATCPPRWEPAYVDFCYWHFGSLAMFQVGGAPWTKWNKAMKSAIHPRQHRDPKRHDFGSWDPVDAWSGEGGRVYSTAMLCLCLETYYRYPRIESDPKK